MKDATVLEKPGEEAEIGYVATPETVAEMKVQGAMYNIEDLIESKTFSLERLWRGFFEKMAQEFGSVAKAVKIMQAIGGNDKVEARIKILRLLKLAGYSDKEAVEILTAADWTLDQMVYANFWLKDDSSGEEVSVAQADLEALDFLLRANVSRPQVISALSKTDCLNRRTINQLIAYGWTWQDFFQALFDSECFNARVYKMLLGFKDQQKKAMFNDNKFMALMSEFEVSDSGRIILLRGMGKKLYQIYKMCLDFGWTKEQLIIALREAGCSAGLIVCAYAEYALGQIDKKENQMEQNIKDHTDDKKDVELAEIASTIEGEITAVKAKTIAMLQKMVDSDREAVDQLLDQELTIMRIIDLLSAGNWTPERALNAIREAGKNEFAITSAINELAEDYEFKGNNYWEADRVRLWKDALKNIFSSREIADAIKI